MTLSRPKPKKCKQCSEPFVPQRMGQKTCDYQCALAFNRVKETQELKRKRLAQSPELRARKEAIKPRKQWAAETQRAFNDYIRARDAHLPCISCGEFYAEPFNGTVWDCGHYKPIGSHIELRFNEINAHRQHSRCNRGAAKSGRNDRTVSAQYRENLVQRIGEELVAWIEGPHKPLKLTIDELKALKAYYKQRTKEALAINQRAN